MATVPLTVEDWLERGLTRKEAQHKVNEMVFGVGYKRDRQGNPIERGLGSAQQPTFQSVAAMKRYHPEDVEGIAAAERALAEYQERKKLEARQREED